MKKGRGGILKTEGPYEIDTGWRQKYQNFSLLCKREKEKVTY